MGMSSSIDRVREYFKRHGFAETVRRAWLATRRRLFANRMVVYYCDLAKLPAMPVNVPELVRIQRVRREEELREEDCEAISSFWNPELAHRDIRDRFAKGACLWLIKSGDNLASYGWTLRALTIEPYYFPLAPEDAHLFDFHVFPQYRGQGMNPLLVAHILHSLAKNGVSRAFIEVAEWNEAQLASLRKTPFHQLGRASSFTILGHKFTHWIEKQNGERPLETNQDGSKDPAMATSHEQ